MVRHGISHAAASLVSLLTADLIGRELAAYSPALRSFIADQLLPALFAVGLRVPAQDAAGVLVVLMLGFVWGVAFRIMSPR